MVPVAETQKFVPVAVICPASLRPKAWPWLLEQLYISKKLPAVWLHPDMVRHSVLAEATDTALEPNPENSWVGDMEQVARLRVPPEGLFMHCVMPSALTTEYCDGMPAQGAGACSIGGGGEATRHAEPWHWYTAFVQAVPMVPHEDADPGEPSAKYSQFEHAKQAPPFCGNRRGLRSRR